MKNGNVLNGRTMWFGLGQQTRRVISFAGVACTAALSVLIAVAQQPAGGQAAGGRGGGRGAPVDAAAVARGKQQYDLTCSPCHGPDAKGGPAGGSDLTISTIVAGPQFAEFLRTGRADTAMLGFALPEQTVADLLTFLRSLTPPLAARGGGRGGTPAEIVGDAKAGEAFFNGVGKCTACHSITGDLKGIGGRLGTTALQGRIVLPRGTGGYPGGGSSVQDFSNDHDKPWTATVTPPGGPAVSGSVLSVSDYVIVVRDAAGVRHSFTRNGDVPKVELKDPVQAHVDLMPKLTDSDMHNLTAYLVTLK